MEKKKSKLWIIIVAIGVIGLVLAAICPKIASNEYDNKNKESKWIGTYQAEIYVNGEYSEELSRCCDLCLTPSNNGTMEINGEQIIGDWSENENQIIITKENEKKITLTKSGGKIIYEYNDDIKAIFYK